VDIWLIWLRVGEYGDTELMAARKSRESAVAWCDENRKLENGDPIQWSDANDEEYGESRNVVLDLLRGEKLRTVNFYSLQVMKLEN
jgi:hypothetical protein